MRLFKYLIYTLAAIAAAGVPIYAAADDTGGAVRDIGSRLELFVDDYLIDTMNGVRTVLHSPVPREVVMVHDEPWEGSGSGYHTIFQDGDLYRMYYKAWNLTVNEDGVSIPHPVLAAYAESHDGKTWVKPDLGLFEFNGSKHNNLVWTGPGSHDFTPFRDPNPSCAPDALYKAVGNGGSDTLLGFKSPDGIHWSLIQDKPIMTGLPFDTQNLAFWDTTRREYRAYVRDFNNGVRGIKTSTSKDFVNWTEPVWLEYPDSPEEALYTNQVKPYYRAPHIFIGFPTRYVDRGWSQQMKALPETDEREKRSLSSLRYGTVVTEGLFMTSRDGKTFHRREEAFVRPGLRFKEGWTYGDNYIAWHIVTTASDIEGAPDELSIYASEGYFRGSSSKLRRYTLRIDGFVSVQAPMSGGELVTKPFTFTGKHLFMNFSTSAAGSVRIEIQDAGGRPVEGFSLDDCPELFGDSLSYIVFWNTGGDLSSLAGKKIRLRFVMKDADLYSIRFR
ncbi:hypothetical protein LLG96_12800 [bacterium]|nr:hypothetical protein [bacterium]